MLPFERRVGDQVLESQNVHLHLKRRFRAFSNCDAEYSLPHKSAKKKKLGKKIGHSLKAQMWAAVIHCLLMQPIKFLPHLTLQQHTLGMRT